MTDFDAYVSGPFLPNDFYDPAYTGGGPAHLHDFSGEWFSGGLNAEAEAEAQIIYDLGEVMKIDRLALWNEDWVGFGTGRLSTSADGVNYSGPTWFQPANMFWYQDEDHYYGVQVFELGVRDARYVKLDISDCSQPEPESAWWEAPGPELCGIGEVAFATTTRVTARHARTPRHRPRWPRLQPPQARCLVTRYGRKRRAPLRRGFCFPSRAPRSRYFVSSSVSRNTRLAQTSGASLFFSARLFGSRSSAPRSARRTSVEPSFLACIQHSLVPAKTRRSPSTELYVWGSTPLQMP